MLWPYGRASNVELSPNDVIAGSALFTVTVNGFENALVSPETIPAVAENKYDPSASVPGTAKSSGAVPAVCSPIGRPFMYKVTREFWGADSSTVSERSFVMVVLVPVKSLGIKCKFDGGSG